MEIAVRKYTSRRTKKELYDVVDTVTGDVCTMTRAMLAEMGSRLVDYSNFKMVVPPEGLNLKPAVDCDSGDWFKYRSRLLLAGKSISFGLCDGFFSSEKLELDGVFKANVSDRKMSELHLTRNTDIAPRIRMPEASHYLLNAGVCFDYYKGYERLFGSSDYVDLYLPVSDSTINVIRAVLIEFLKYLLTSKVKDLLQSGIKVKTSKAGIEFVNTDVKGCMDIVLWTGTSGFYLGSQVDMFHFRSAVRDSFADNFRLTDDDRMSSFPWNKLIRIYSDFENAAPFCEALRE